MSLTDLVRKALPWFMPAVLSAQVSIDPALRYETPIHGVSTPAYMYLIVQEGQIEKRQTPVVLTGSLTPTTDGNQMMTGEYSAHDLTNSVVSNNGQAYMKLNLQIPEGCIAGKGVIYSTQSNSTLADRVKPNEEVAPASGTYAYSSDGLSTTLAPNTVIPYQKKSDTSVNMSPFGDVEKTFTLNLYNDNTLRGVAYVGGEHPLREVVIAKADMNGNSVADLVDSNQPFRWGAQNYFDNEGIQSYKDTPLGWVLSNSDVSPFVFHFDHGWLYPVGDNASTFMFNYNVGDHWQWTNEQIYPWLFDFNKNGWLSYLEGSKNPQLFYDANGNNWITDEDLRQGK